MQQFINLLFTKGKNVTAFEKLWVLAPLAVWFSYHPLLRFGQNASMYFEVSVTLVYVLALALSGIPKIIKAKTELMNRKAVWLASAFVLMSAVSLLWTPDLTRGLLTLGLIGLLFIVLLTSMVRSRQLRALKPMMFRVLVISTVFMSLLSFLQVIAAIWVDSSAALLCRGCTPSQFGFARPNGLTIEPQFFGNILLAPALMLFHRFLTKRVSRPELASFLIIATALFLTLSRGAIYAFAAGVILLWFFYARKIRIVLVSLSVLLISFASSLLLQGAAAAANPEINTTFKSAVAASINQLSLGIVDFSDTETDKEVSEKPAVSEAGKKENDAPVTDREVEPNFDGYVEESTNVRLKLSDLALESWSRTLGRAIFGTGLGGSGTVLQEEFPSQVNQREIVQNEYVEILLENGFIGLGLFVVLIGSLMYQLRHHRWILAVVVAYLLQWNFFSGYPNALHIYLLLIAVFVLYGKVQQAPQKVK